MSRLFKIAYTIDNEIKKIFVFCGDTISEEDKVISNERIFNEKNRRLVEKDNPEIIYVDKLIHNDDTIDTIKMKIVSECNLGVSVQEMYLFGREEMNASPEEIYNALTHNDSVPLTKDCLYQFLCQFHDSDLDLDVLEDKEIYEYDDIVKISFAPDTKINKPIGQKFTSIETNYCYTINPFNLIVVDKHLKDYLDKLFSSTGHEILLSVNNIEDDIIFLCLMGDVLETLDNSLMSEELATRIYFPLMEREEIYSLEELNKNKEKLLIESEKMIDKNFIANDRIISTLIKTFELKRHELKYISKGIKSIKIDIHSEQKIKLPLEMIFKLFHATEQYPLIKYTPDSKVEKLYRLYSPNKSIDGKEIPLLSKSEINKDKKRICQNKSIMIRIAREDDNPIYCEFVLFLFQGTVPETSSC